ncbi:MAG: Sec-independent protein translocase protein TatB [Rhodospirillaceae bacterium]|nr:Sec-independent protein translocase protein TatB [Rhodospirillaceae bacterium]
MLDLAWSEIAVIGLVAVLILGPKELPKAMRAVAQFMRKARKLAGEFQGHWNDAMRESELDEVKKTVQKISSTNLGSEVEKFIDPSGEFARELDDTIGQTRREIEGATQLNAPAPVAATPAATPATNAPPAAAPASSAAA